MIRRAEPQDRAKVEALLAAAALPVDGVAEHFGAFFIVDEGGRIVGAAGQEIYGANALLRSVVVAGDARGRGLGSLLTRRELREAKARGAQPCTC
jgi:amino-acid N-acetyltransferase